MPLDITAIILTYNESLHLNRCIESLHDFVSRVVVVDSFSTDETKLISELLGADFYQNPWINHANQFNWALENTSIKTAWVFRIDADEYIEPSLKIEVAQALSNCQQNISGYFVRRKYIFMNQWIRYGAMYPVETLRLFRLGHGRAEQRWMDEHIVLESGSSRKLQGNIVDYNLNSVDWWIAKHNKYATLEMVELLNIKLGIIQTDNLIIKQIADQAKYKRWLKNFIYAKLPLFVRPFLYFLYRYFLKMGFLDGRIGFAFHFMQGFWYRCLVDLKLLEAESWIGKETDTDVIKGILREKTGLSL